MQKNWLKEWPNRGKWLRLNISELLCPASKEGKIGIVKEREAWWEIYSKNVNMSIFSYFHDPRKESSAGVFWLYHSDCKSILLGAAVDADPNL